MSSSSDTSASTANKRELARALRVTTVTLGNWLEKWPEFPVVSRGTHGRDYVFDVAKVVEFLAEKKEAEAAAQAEKDEALAQMVLPLLTVDQPEAAATGRLTLKEQSLALELSIKRRKEAEALGRLVSVDDVTETLHAALSGLNRALRSAIRSAATDQNLPPSVTRALEQRFAEAQRAFVREARAYLDAAEVEDIHDV